MIAKDRDLAEGEKSAAAEADRHRPLPVQGRFIGLLDRPAPASLSCSTSTSRKATQLTSGGMSAPARLVAGRQPHRLRDEAGPDPDRHLNSDIYVIEPRQGRRKRRSRALQAPIRPDWESRPAWSPDSKRIAYLQSGEDKWIYYKPWSLAVIDVASGEVDAACRRRAQSHEAASSRPTGERSSRWSRTAA